MDTQVRKPADTSTAKWSWGGRTFSLGDVVAFAVIAVLATVLVWSRFSLLNASFWQDEAYSAVRYIDPGPRRSSSVAISPTTMCSSACSRG